MTGNDPARMAPPESNWIDAALGDLCGAAGLMWVALLHETGVVLAQSGDEGFRDQGEIGALTAGAYHATAMLAGRFGDSGIEGLCHEGKRHSFLVIPVDDRHLLLAVFPSACKPGVVRLCLQRTAARLRGGAVARDVSASAPCHAGDWLES